MILLMAMAAAAASPASVEGRWMTETKHGVVEVGKCGASLCGALLDSDGIRANPHLMDVKNKDESLRGRPLRGVRMLSGFSWSDGQWTGGQVYNADDGGTYKGTLTQLDADHLRVRGCIVWPLCKSQTWTRIR